MPQDHHAQCSYPQVLATGLSALYSSLPRKIEVCGDDWHCLRREDWIVVSSLVLFMNKLKELEQFRFLRLRGLDVGKRYHNTLDGCTHTGEYYMRVGLNLSNGWLTEFSHKLIILTEE